MSKSKKDKRNKSRVRREAEAIHKQTESIIRRIKHKGEIKHATRGNCKAAR